MAEEDLNRNIRAGVSRIAASPVDAWTPCRPSATAFRFVDPDASNAQHARIPGDTADTQGVSVADAAKYAANRYPDGLELVQAQLMVRHGERTPLGGLLVMPGIPAKWPLCADHKTSMEATAAKAADGPTPDNHSRVRMLVNPSTRDMEAVKVESWIESVNGSDGRFQQARGEIPPSPGLVSFETPAPPPDNVCGVGILTDVGRKSAYDLGVRIRKLYVDKLGLLPSSIGPGHDIKDNSDSDNKHNTSSSSSSLLYIRSTPWSRTVETVMHLYMGLYPAAHRPAASSASSPPVKLFFRHLADENLYLPMSACPRLRQLHRQFLESNAIGLKESPALHYVDHRVDNLLSSAGVVASLRGAPLADTPRPRIGLHSPSLDPVHLMDLIHTITAHQHAWSELRLPPELADPRVQDALNRSAATQTFAPYRASREARALAAGPILRDIVEKMVQRAEGRGAGAQTRLGLYGCHDTSVGMTSAALGHPGPFWPPYTSVLAFEMLRARTKSRQEEDSVKKTWPREIGRRKMQDLARDEQVKLDGYYVRTLLNDQPIVVPHCAKDGNHLKGDPSLCLLKAFKTVVDDMALDWNEACQIVPAA